jgi:predicted acyl esterase
LDVGNDGSVSEPTKGFLKASHRKLDQNLSKPYRPYHPHLEAEPVVPGDVYEYAIELPPTSNVFKKGHRIKIDISSMDHPSMGRLPNAPLGAAHHPWHVGSSKTTLHKIYRNTKYQSHLLLPIIPAKS